MRDQVAPSYLLTKHEMYLSFPSVCRRIAIWLAKCWPNTFHDFIVIVGLLVEAFTVCLVDLVLEELKNPQLP